MELTVGTPHFIWLGISDTTLKETERTDDGDFSIKYLSIYQFFQLHFIIFFCNSALNLFWELQPQPS